MPNIKKAKDGLTSRMPVIAMTPEMFNWIEKRAEKLGKSRADIVREAVEKEKQRVEEEGE